MFQIKIPASSANLGAGFDCFGLALNLYLTLQCNTAPNQTNHKIKLSGQGADTLPLDETNLILQVASFVAQKEQLSLPKLELKIENQLPLARGLGSSAGAIVAGIAIVEAILKNDFPTEKFFRYATEFENHPDNIAAARYGGFTIAVDTKQGNVLTLKQRWPEKIKAIVAIPNFTLDTQKARSVLPTSYSRGDAIFNLQHALLFQAAIIDEKYDLISTALKDRWHQPYRSRLVPGLEEALILEMSELLGVALSGSGPTILALSTGNFANITESLKEIFDKHNIEIETKLLEIDQQGRTIEFLHE